MRTLLPIALLVCLALGLLGAASFNSTTRVGAVIEDAEYVSSYVQPGSPEPVDQTTYASVSGTVLDEHGTPLYAVPVCLIPVGGECKLEQMDWTEKNGGFLIRHLESGEYYLQAQHGTAPTGEHPFLPLYYQNKRSEKFADRIIVNSGSHIELHPVILNSVEVTTVRVRILWSDGGNVESSNLLFHNLSFPEQGVIGDVAPNLLDGAGEIVLPTGYKYLARAVTHCDAGPQIESRESRPVQEIDVTANNPAELTFVIAGPPCKHWEPK